jgi:hypothetical protein
MNSRVCVECGREFQLPSGHLRCPFLELWTRPQPKGVRTDDAVAWAREIIARYGDETPPKEKGDPAAA